MKRARLPLLLLTLLVSAPPAFADILIGAAAPLSGPNAALGEQLRRGVQRAVDDINATGGIRGEKLTVQFADDGCDPRKAVDVATGFVSAGIKAVVGHYCSGASIPASKVYQKAGIVQISPASTNTKFTDEGGWNVVRLVPRDDALGHQLVDGLPQRADRHAVALREARLGGQRGTGRPFAFDEALRKQALHFAVQRLETAGRGEARFDGLVHGRQSTMRIIQVI